MSLIKVGTCSNCGKCCLREGKVITEGPCVDVAEDRCRFYSENENGMMYGHCLIYGRGWAPIDYVKDRFGTQISQAQIDWFNQNCIDYPTAEDAEAGVYPPAECSFSFEEG